MEEARVETIAERRRRGNCRDKKDFGTLQNSILALHKKRLAPLHQAAKQLHYQHVDLAAGTVLAIVDDFTKYPTTVVMSFNFLILPNAAKMPDERSFFTTLFERCWSVVLEVSPV